MATRGATPVRSSWQQAASADSTASRSPTSSAIDSSGTQVGGFEDSVSPLAQHLNRRFRFGQLRGCIAKAGDAFFEELESLLQAHVLRLEGAHDLLEPLHFLFEAHVVLSSSSVSVRSARAWMRPSRTRAINTSPGSRPVTVVTAAPSSSVSTA